MMASQTDSRPSESPIVRRVLPNAGTHLELAVFNDHGQFLGSLNVDFRECAAGVLIDGASLTHVVNERIS